MSGPNSKPRRRRRPASSPASRFPGRSMTPAPAPPGPRSACPIGLGRCAPRSDQRPGQARHHLQAFDSDRKKFLGDGAEHLFGDRNIQPADGHNRDRDRTVGFALDGGAAAHDNAAASADRDLRQRKVGQARGISPTGTTLAAGITTASNDPVTHNTLSADQKLFGPLHVTTAVSDIGEPTSKKSITAGFKLTW